MRVQYGRIPPVEGIDPAAEGLRPIRGPGSVLSQVVGSLTGLFLLVFLIGGLCFFLSMLAIPNPDVDPNYVPPVAWPAVILALLTYIPMHELLHVLLHPAGGLSGNSVLVIWPQRLIFGAYYEGCMSRRRWLLMRIAPFVLLSVIPAIVIAILQYVAFSHAVRTFIEVVVTVNAVGSGGDLAGMLLVLRQVPAPAQLCFRGGRAFWQPA